MFCFTDWLLELVAVQNTHTHKHTIAHTHISADRSQRHMKFLKLRIPDWTAAGMKDRRLKCRGVSKKKKKIATETFIQNRGSQNNSPDSLTDVGLVQKQWIHSSTSRAWRSENNHIERTGRNLWEMPCWRIHVSTGGAKITKKWKENQKEIAGKKDQKVILYRKTKKKVSDHDFNIETSDCTPRLSSSYVCTRPLAVALMFEVYFFVGPDWTVQWAGIGPRATCWWLLL